MQQIPHKLDHLATMLEEEFGQCPLGRQALLKWLQEQLERAEKVPGAPASAVAAMIDGGYVRWRAEQLGIEHDFENAPAVGREFGSTDFDAEDPEIIEMFESGEIFPEREQPADQEHEGLDDEESN